MISKLNLSEFVNELEENTTKGNPSIKGTPLVILTIFEDTKKKFYGEFNKSSFRLTRNSVFYPIPYIFEGKINVKNDSSTNISLKIKPIWFGYLWIRILPIFALILFNIGFITQENIIATEIPIFRNILVILMFAHIWYTIRKKKKLLKDFHEIFKISED